MKRKASRSSYHGKHRMVECDKCGKKMRSDNLNVHLKIHNPMKPCKYCTKNVRQDLLLRHETLCEAKVDEVLCDRKHAENLETSLQHSSVSGCFKNFVLDVEKSLDYDVILRRTTAAAKDMLQSMVTQQPIKAQIVLKLMFSRTNPDSNTDEYAEKVMRSICEPLVVGDDMDGFLDRAQRYIRAQLTAYESWGSGWQFHELNTANVEVARYKPLAGSGTMKIPKKVKDIKSVLNITSPDDKCFLYCLLAGLGKSNGGRPWRHTTYKDKVGDIDMGDVTFPVKIKDIPKIEELNKISISVFQWSIEDEHVVPLKHGTGVGPHIDLLYIQNEYTGHFFHHRSR